MFKATGTGHEGKIPRGLTRVRDLRPDSVKVFFVPV